MLLQACCKCEWINSVTKCSFWPVTLSGRHLGSAVGLAQERNRLGRTPVSPESAAVQVRRFQQFPGSLYSAPRQRYISHEMGLLGTTQAHHDHRQRPEHDDDVSSLRAHLTPRDTLRALATPHMRGARIGGHPGLYGWVLGMYVIHTFKNERLQSTRICNKPIYIYSIYIFVKRYAVRHTHLYSTIQYIHI